MHQQTLGTTVLEVYEGVLTERFRFPTPSTREAGFHFLFSSNVRV